MKIDILHLKGLNLFSDFWKLKAIVIMFNSFEDIPEVLRNISTIFTFYGFEAKGEIIDL